MVAVKDREPGSPYGARLASDAVGISLDVDESGIAEFLLGTDVLAPSERLVLTLGRVLREDFLQQSAFDEVDGFCALEKQAAMLGLVRAVHRAAEAALARGVPAEQIDTLPALGEVARMREWPAGEAVTEAAALAATVQQAMEAL